MYKKPFYNKITCEVVDRVFYSTEFKPIDMTVFDYLRNNGFRALESGILIRIPVSVRETFSNFLNESK